MKLHLIQIFQTAEHISKLSFFSLKITVGCPPCTCPSIRVCVVCLCNVWCMVSVVCVRGVCCVCGAAWHAENLPCVGPKRLRVDRQNARMCSTCARFARTHGGLFHGGPLSLSLSSPSLFLSSFLVSLFLHSLPSYFSRSLSLLSSLLSSLSATMTMITRPVDSLSLCKHGS